MDTETQKIIQGQLGKLPNDVVRFISSSNWDNEIEMIASAHSIPKDELSDLRREVILVLSGLVHPDAFAAMLIRNVGLSSELAVDLAEEVEQKIFASVRPALVKFFEDEQAVAEEQGELPEEGAVTEKPAPVSVAPANLPTEAMPEPIFPPLTAKVMAPKPAEPEVILMHPFEEKMQSPVASVPAPMNTPMPSTFTPAVPTIPQAPQNVPVMSPDVPVAAPAPQGALAFTPASSTSPRGTLTHDPYREALE